METYKILVTGTGISGKSNLARKLEKDLLEIFEEVTNKDVDWDKDALVVPASGVYILQTPKGCEAKSHGIIPANFNKILYSIPSEETYIQFLTSRAYAWFIEGITEKGKDTSPKPYSQDKLPEILKNILGYAIKRERLVKEDLAYFTQDPKLFTKTIQIEPIIKNANSLSFKGYDKALEKIIEDAISDGPNRY